MKRSKRNTPELKANKSNDRIKVKVLEGLAKCKNTAVIWLWIDKKHTYPHVKKSAQNKAYHYNYLMGKIIDLIPSADMFHSTLNMTVFMDLYFKSKRIRRDELEKYLIKRVSWKNSKINLKVEQIDSTTNNGLQVVDFVSYALFRCLEYGDCKYHDIMEKSKSTITKKQIY